MSENDLICSNEKCVYNPHGINKGNCGKCTEGQLSFKWIENQSSASKVNVNE